MKRICFSFFIALFALACFSQQLKAEVPPIIWYKTFGGNISGLSLHPNGAYLLLGDQANIVSSEDGHVVKNYTHPSNTYSKFSPTGKYVGLGGWRDDHQNGQITLFDFETDSTKFQKYFVGSPVGGFDISPDETSLIVGRKGWLDFYDIESGAKTDSIAFTGTDNHGQPKDFYIYDACYSPDGRYIAFTSEKRGGLVVIDANTKEELFSYGTTTNYSRIRFSPNSKLLAFNSNHKNIAMEILSLDSMKVIDSVAGYTASCADIIFTKDSKNILYSGLGSLAYLKKYDLNSRTLNTISENWNGYRFLTLSPINDTLFSSVGDILLAENISSYLGIDETYSIPLNILLNSSQNTLSLNFPTITGTEFLIRIVNIEGQVVKSFGAFSSSDIFSADYDISDLASGTYILSVQGNGVNSSTTFQIVR